VAAGGLLLGTAEFNRIKITGFEPFPGESGEGRFVASGEDSTRFGALVRKWSDAGSTSRVVGYFRRGMREELRLYAEDLALIHEFFRDPASVFLIVQPGGGVAGIATGGFFFWNRGEVFADFSFMPFPFDPILLTPGNVPIPEKDGAPAGVSGESINVRVSRSFAVILRQAGTRAAVACGMVLLVLLVLSAAIYRTKLQSSSAQKAAFEANSPAGALALSVLRSGSDVAITWNPASPGVRDARVGVLSIQDGNTRRELPLTARMLQDSRIVYTPASASPASASIEVALELFSASGKSTRERVIILLNRSSDTVGSNAGEPATRREAMPTPRKTVPVVAARDADSGADPEGPATEAQQVLASRMIARPDKAAQESPAIPAPDQSGFDRSAVSTLPQPALLSSAISVPEIETVQVQRSAPAPPLADPPRFAPETAPEILPPRAIRQAKPELPASVRNMVSQEVEIRVKVTVDAAGRVTKVESLAPKGALGEYLGTAAAAAARVWKFEPARQDGHPIPAEVVLQFRFAPEKKQ
jgi:protein TonB